MAIKKINPLTHGQRFKVVTTFDDLTVSKPEKNLTKVTLKTYFRLWVELDFKLFVKCLEKGLN